MSISKTKIYYLGPKGSYTEQAAREFFGAKKKLTEAYDVNEILNNVEQQNNVYGVVPVENSMEGSLNVVLDEVVEKDLKIIGEVYMPISHCLLSRDEALPRLGDKTRHCLVSTIYAHPQALAQSRDWLRNNLPQAELKETVSNSAAAKIILKQKNSAAIASEYCAKIYKLNIMARQLEENLNNYTRFWILGKKGAKPPMGGLAPAHSNKISVFIILHDRVGALRDLLNIFAKHKINLSKIESRAIKGQAWHYGFFVDFDGNLKDTKIKSALKAIEREVAVLKILGNYENRQLQDRTTDYLINYLRELFEENGKFTTPATTTPPTPPIRGEYSAAGGSATSSPLIGGVGGVVGGSEIIPTNLLQTRLLLIPSVALYKFQNKIPLNKIYQPKREQEIIKKRLLQIKKKNISASKLLLKLMNKNLAASRELQRDIYRGLAAKKIKPNQIKKVSLSKLRNFLDQVDNNFDEVVAWLSKKEQERVLKSLLG